MEKNPIEFLETIYSLNMEAVGSAEVIKSDLNGTIRHYLDEILDKSESAKGVLTVIITSLVYKHFYPLQDIRRHQSSIQNGYAGRTFDQKFITPFLKNFDFLRWRRAAGLLAHLSKKFLLTGPIRELLPQLHLKKLS